MKNLNYFSLLLIVLILCLSCPVLAMDTPWTGSLEDGTVIDENDLKKILKKHDDWCNNKEEGEHVPFDSAKLQRVDLKDANLEGALFIKTDLQMALLSNANLQNASLLGANLHGAWLASANLQGVEMDLQPGGIPDVYSMSFAKNLAGLRYRVSPNSLFEIRNEFKKLGLREQERSITYAIKQSEFENPLADTGAYSKKIQVWFGWFFFKLTSEWGMAPERSLYILFLFIFVFTLPYYVSLRGAFLSVKLKNDGIWKVWIPGRMRMDLGSNKPELLTLTGWKSIKTAFYFSLLSAFNIGWKDFNVGNWIARLQPKEYSYQASGWVRSVSGLQSVMSVYLLALWVLTYFGSPFESY